MIQLQRKLAGEVVVEGNKVSGEYGQTYINRRKKKKKKMNFKKRKNH